MSTMVIRREAVVGADVLSKSKTLTGTSLTRVDEVVADSETDFEIVVAIDVDQIKGVVIVSDQDVLLETNDGAAPDDTLPLTADDPYVWDEDSYDDCRLTVDVTSVFVTNASGSAANVSIWCLSDATP